MSKSNFSHLLEYTPIWLALRAGRLLPFNMRRNLVGALGGFLVSRVSGLRKRALHQINMVFPDWSDEQKIELCRAVGRNTGRTLAELLNNDQFREIANDFEISGQDGLAALTKAKEEKTGAIIVSGHFGQWEAIRHAMRRLGCEAGAVYKKNANPHYEERFLWAIKIGGEPIVETGARGSRQMVKHIKQGGFFALLPDQRILGSGKMVPFLGHDAPTSLAAAELALRYNVPLIPAYGIRDKGTIRIEFEAPIPPTTPLQMMTEVNDSLSKRVLAQPEQWYWLHHRWDKP